jgi:hypothetical protein
MNTSEHINEISAALSKAQGEMKNATLNRTNPHFKSRYADLAGIRDAVTPALAKHGLAVVQGTEMAGTTLMVFTRLVHASGQWFESQFPVAIDKPQAMGSGITYGRRYTLSAICNIAADEDDDANAANDSKPQVALGLTGGTSGASKAATRADFDNMVKSVRNAATVKALDGWKISNAAEFDKLPPDWLDELRQEFVDRKAELVKALAA